jgi:stage II sporulation protein D
LALVRALAALALVTAPGSAGAAGDCGGTIRVLLKRGDGQLSLAVSQRGHVFERAGRAVRVDGKQVVPSWRSPKGKRTLVAGIAVEDRVEVLPAGSGLEVVAHVPLERYVAGAVAGEIPALWAEEALRAQAIVSRTYALHQRRAHAKRSHHVEAGTRSQVFAGSNVPASVSGAVRDTRCQVLTHRGAPILAVFHSASGGRTASAAEVWGRDLGYLVSLPVDGEDDSPDTYWRVSVSRTTLSRALSAAGHPIGRLEGTRVTSRSASGRVGQIQFRGQRGEVVVTGRELRGMLGESTLRSTMFELRPSESGVVFVGSGHGHGVGMSQWGARGLAERGASYGEILSTFYPGTKLERWDAEAKRADARHSSGRPTE